MHVYIGCLPLKSGYQMDATGMKALVLKSRVFGSFPICARVDPLPLFPYRIIGDGKLNPIVGVYIPIIRIPY